MAIICWFYGGYQWKKWYGSGHRKLGSNLPSYGQIELWDYTSHNNTSHNNTSHNNTLHNNTSDEGRWSGDKTSHNNTSHNNTLHNNNYII